MPSTSGTHAATSAPNATTRMSSVIGSEISSARCRSSSTIVVIAESNEPSPACCSVTPGCAARTARTTAATPSARLGRVVGIAAQPGLDEHGAPAGRRRAQERRPGPGRRRRRRCRAGAARDPRRRPRCPARRRSARGRSRPPDRRGRRRRSARRRAPTRRRRPRRRSATACRRCRRPRCSRRRARATARSRSSDGRPRRPRRAGRRAPARRPDGVERGVWGHAGHRGSGAARVSLGRGTGSRSPLPRARPGVTPGGRGRAFALAQRRRVRQADAQSTHRVGSDT